MSSRRTSSLGNSSILSCYRLIVADLSDQCIDDDKKG
jgi:hypothetical protein